MGISNTCQLLLSDECSIFSRLLLDFQQGSQHDHRQIIAQDDLENFDENLEIKVPQVLGVKVEEDYNDIGCKTPTSLEHKIPSFICPPAPTKPKSIPSNKRKPMSCRRSLLDFSTELESMFPQTLLADLAKKIKKVTTTN